MAMAARMALANSNPYDTAVPGAGGPTAASSFYDSYGGASAAAAAGQPSMLGEEEDATVMLYAQRARELELLHLQQQIQERQAIENEARSRLLEHAARNQIEEYERARMQLELMAEMRHRDREAMIGAEMNSSAYASANAMLSSQDAAAAQKLREQQLAEYIATQHNEAAAHQYYDSDDSEKKTSSPPDKHPSNIESSLMPTVHEPSREGSSKVPIDTPSSSQLGKKRKTTPSKKAAAAAGNKAKRAKKSPGAGGGKKATASALVKRKPGVPSMDDIVPPITEAQYENVEALMTEFCKVPFLAEFSRPVSLLHPELVTLYSKIIHHPMDLGHICRAIRRREYKNTRAIQLDVWRVFSNCIKFHMHPTNKDNAIPSFISISMHLRNFFNSLWREYMMPSDAPPRPPGKGISHLHSTFQKRAEARKERLVQVSTTALTPKCLHKLAGAFEGFVSSGGNTDKLDRDAILGDVAMATGDIATFTESLRGVITTMQTKVLEGEEYTVLELHRDVKKCYTEDVFEHDILKKMKISQRLDRILGKALAPIHEVACRGVNQSSIWGCMAAAIWARESKKKPYWPAIVLGM